jgi:hypothetical protein
MARVCAEEEPHPVLEFVDNISPVREPVAKSLLETELGRMLREKMG